MNNEKDLTIIVVEQKLASAPHLANNGRRALG
jgi:hypothetical protein